MVRLWSRPMIHPTQVTSLSNDCTIDDSAVSINKHNVWPAMKQPSGIFTWYSQLRRSCVVKDPQNKQTLRPQHGSFRASRLCKRVEKQRRLHTSSGQILQENMMAVSRDETTSWILMGLSITPSIGWYEGCRPIFLELDGGWDEELRRGLSYQTLMRPF